MYVVVLRAELRATGCRSLKDKRTILRPIIDGLRNRHHVSVAEVDHHDTWQRAAIGWAVVGADAGHVTRLADATERFVWSFPEIEILSVQRYWPELD